MALWVIGSGSPEHARGFAEAHDLRGRVLSDPSRASYRALGMRRDAGAFLTPRVLGNAARAWKGGFRQGRTQGDPWQQGGVAVVRRDGSLEYLQISDSTGAHAPVAELLAAAARAARGEGSS
ncbi:MAG: hypothetical protein IT376_16780 [Polyangiaceae bacterium]|nr:hypothetical protein [Polyangiaceae bacterium]